MASKWSNFVGASGGLGGSNSLCLSSGAFDRYKEKARPARKVLKGTGSHLYWDLVDPARSATSACPTTNVGR